MEPLEIDDINFFPCTCGYQVCFFLVIFFSISHSYYANTNSLENTSERKILMNCMFDRFVDFVGIEFEQMKMGFVLLAERFV